MKIFITRRKNTSFIQKNQIRAAVIGRLNGDGNEGYNAQAGMYSMIDDFRNGEINAKSNSFSL